MEHVHIIATSGLSVCYDERGVGRVSNSGGGRLGGVGVSVGVSGVSSVSRFSVGRMVSCSAVGGSSVLLQHIHYILPANRVGGEQIPRPHSWDDFILHLR